MPCATFRLLLFSLTLCCSAAAAADIDYGAGKVNSLPKTAGAAMGGRDDYDYLALKDQAGPSGVPLGGIGVGCFDYAPDGRFTRLLINNWHGADQSPVIHTAPGTFLATWQGGTAHLLQRGGDPYAGMPPADHTVYRGLFPIAECRFDDGPSVRAWSGLVPQDVKDSSLPLAWIEVTLRNPSAQETAAAAAFSWQDLIGRGLLDVRDLDLLHRFGNTAWQRGDAERAAAAEHKPFWVPLPRVPTRASPFTVGGFTGVRQHSEPLQPILKTYQNYNNEIAVLAEQTAGAEITTLPAYPVDSPDAAWASFRATGRFAARAGEESGPAGAPLFEPAAGKEMASAVAVRVTLKPHETRTIRFLVAWFQPELIVNRAADDPATYFGKADYGRYYQNFFHTLPELIQYAARERPRINEETRAWQQPILDSTYPDWLKFKLINSAYTLYTNTILNRAGDFTVMEGGMGGLAGTMDQCLSAHPVYQKLFPALDRSQLEVFGHTPGPEGQILHFDGHYYWGLASRDGTTPVPDNSMLDNTGSWLLQLAKEWQQTGDTAWLGQFRGEVGRSLGYLRSQVASQQFQIPTGSTTYDDFWHPPLYAYNATTYPAFLRAGSVLWNAFGDSQQATRCRDASDLSAQDAMRALWNGRFFAYGSDLDGSNRQDNILFSGQLAGQFLSRYCRWGDLFPLDVVRASVVAQLKTNAASSPDDYAPKVWLVKEGRAMNDPRRPDDPNADSTCWPFYLESYTAMAAIQAGYLDDGLEIMRHIQLVNLRNGWTWSQDLWRPGELTYMTAPVTWFITDVLAGSGLDVPAQTLYLSPVLRPADQRVVLPIFFPRFWATATADRRTHRLTLKITRVFDEPDAPGRSEAPNIILRTVVAQPAGIPTCEARRITIPPFAVRSGAVLDLSAHWDQVIGCKIQDPVLPHANQQPFLVAQPRIVLAPEVSPAASSFVDSVAVSITAASPGAQVFYTLDGRDPRSAGRPYHGPVELTNSATLRTSARVGDAWSPVEWKSYVREEYRKPDLPAGTPAGRWRWHYYEGTWDRLPDFSTLTPLAAGETDHLGLEMRRRDLHFGMVFDRVLNVPTRGIYTFHLSSDDGSRLTIGGRDILDNDGVHDSREVRTLAIPMEPGCYSLKLEYFQNDGGSDLKLSWTPPSASVCQETHP